MRDGLRQGGLVRLDQEQIATSGGPDCAPIAGEHPPRPVQTNEQRRGDGTFGLGLVGVRRDRFMVVLLLIFGLALVPVSPVLAAVDCSACGPGVNLSGCDLRGAHFTGADLSDASMTHVDLDGANLRGVVWDNTTCPSGELSSVHSPEHCDP